MPASCHDFPSKKITNSYFKYFSGENIYIRPYLSENPVSDPDLTTNRVDRSKGMGNIKMVKHETNKYIKHPKHVPPTPSDYQWLNKNSLYKYQDRQNLHLYNQVSRTS